MGKQNGNGQQAKRGQIVDRHDVPGDWEDEIDGGYNPADFIISGSDHQGHNERIFCRVQPQHARAGNVIFRSKKFPFRTEGDLFRWAYVRGLKVLDQMEHMGGFLGVADAITEILRQETYQQEFKEMFARMEVVINKYVAMGANKEARKLLSTVLRQLRTIDEEGDHWKRTCEMEVMQRFGHLLDGRQKAGIVSLQGLGPGAD